MLECVLNIGRNLEQPQLRKRETRFVVLSSQFSRVALQKGWGEEGE